jgi:hypothetical protein
LQQAPLKTFARTTERIEYSDTPHCATATRQG